MCQRSAAGWTSSASAATPTPSSGTLDVDALGELTDEDLASLRVSLGHRRRILKAIREGGAPAPSGRGGPRRRGGRRHATVLFADVAGFTGLSERLDPESVHALMEVRVDPRRRDPPLRGHDHPLRRRRHDGPLRGAAAQEDHAARAAHAALDLQAALADYGAEVERRLGVSFRMRIGFTPARIVGHLGDDHRMEYTALGDAVNLAARLEQIAEPGEICAVSEHPPPAGEAFEWIDLGSRPGARQERPAAVHRLQGRTLPAAAALGGARLRPPRRAPRSWGCSREAWASAVGGRGGSCRSGEAGLGKSRLLLEFTRHLQDDDARLVEGTCFTYGENTSFLPFLRIVRALRCRRGADPELAAKAAIAARLDRLGLASEITAPYLHNLLSYGVDDEVFPYLTPELVRRRTGSALRALLAAEARERLLAIVIEDVHWIDKATEEVIGELVDELADRRILLALAYRPEYLNQWRRCPPRRGPPPPAARGGRLRDGPLDPGEALRRKRRAPAADGRPDARGGAAHPRGGGDSPELEQLIVDRTEGNPLFVEELTRRCWRRRRRPPGGRLPALTAGRGARDPAEPGGGAARTHRPAARRTCGPPSGSRPPSGASSRRRSWPPPRPSSAVPGHLERLEALDFVHQVGPGLAGDYSFKHVLTQESVYSTLVARSRAACHAAVGAPSRRLYPDRLEENAEAPSPATLTRPATRRRRSSSW